MWCVQATVLDEDCYNWLCAKSVRWSSDETPHAIVMYLTISSVVLTILVSRAILILLTMSVAPQPIAVWYLYTGLSIDLSLSVLKNLTMSICEVKYSDKHLFIELSSS